MALLYYWRPDNYLRDRRFGFGYHLSQSNHAVASAEPGDSLWAFTRRRVDGLYVLAAELIVRAVTQNRPNYRYGRFRVWGDLNRSRYFDTEIAPSAEPLIRALHISARGAHLGQAFQGLAAVRKLTDADHQLVAAFARHLPTLNAVRIYPEDEFEAGLVYGLGKRAAVVREEAEYGQRLQYLYETVDIQRARRHVDRLQELYAGKCQICLFDPRTGYGHQLCHGHHIQWLSRGGDDELENMLLVCPNHHAAIHRDDSVFDYATLSVAFTNGRVERVRLNRHLRHAL